MGFVNTEQTTAIIESVAKVVDAAQPETTVIESETNYVAWAIVGLVPMIVGGVWTWLKRRKKI